MKSSTTTTTTLYTALLLLLATSTLASPTPYPTPAAIAPSYVPFPISPATTPTTPSTTTTTTTTSSPDSVFTANAAQSSAILALLAQSPSPPTTTTTNTTLIEILVTSDQQMYLRYQHSNPQYRDFNTTDGLPPPATGPGQDDDLGYSMMMEALYGGQKGSLGESLRKAWGLYRSVYGGLPSGVPSSVLSSGTGAATATTTTTTGAGAVSMNGMPSGGRPDLVQPSTNPLPGATGWPPAGIDSDGGAVWAGKGGLSGV